MECQPGTQNEGRRACGRSSKAQNGGQNGFERHKDPAPQLAQSQASIREQPWNLKWGFQGPKMNGPGTSRELQGSKWKPKWTLRVPKISKKPEKRALKKTPKIQHCKKWVTGSIWGQKWTPFWRRKPPPNHTNPTNPQNWSPGLQNEPLGFQNDTKSHRKARWRVMQRTG